MVTARELDRAVKAGKAELTRPNVRPLRCAHCRLLCQKGEAVRLWIGGIKRGFLCRKRCARNVSR